MGKGPRITGGDFRNRRLPEVAPGIRPAKDQTRLALFSMIGPVVEGASVLDLFAGTGAYGFDCMSRGASRVCWIDQSRDAVDNIEKQIRDWDLSSGAFVCECGEVLKNLERLVNLHRPTIIVADPPYELIRSEDILKMTLQKLHLNPKLTADCLFIAEQPPRLDPPVQEGWNLIRDRTYGKTRLIIYRHEI